MENGNWKIETRNSKTEIRKSSPCLPLSPAKNQPSPLGRGCRAAGVFSSRSATGEGLLQARTGPEDGNWKIETRNSKTEIRKSSPCLPPSLAKSQPSPLGRGCRAADAFFSRSATGEGLLQSRTKPENGNSKIERRCSRQFVAILALPSHSEIPASFAQNAPFYAPFGARFVQIRA
jgi:hypothetical protein